MVKVDYKEIQAILNKYCPDDPVTESEAAEAFHNAVNFVNLLMQINDRVGLVPDEPQK
ncbi:MAG TPA: hypothetical protein VMV79_04865 [Alphaproteobacteria bacterium]|nr:hypothetical protein [Alphaproteobacteria bacterium]